MSVPRLRRTVAPTPPWRSRSAKAATFQGGLAGTPYPGVGLRGMRLTCAAGEKPRSRRARASAWAGASLTPPIMAYSKLSRRPDAARYSRAAASTSAEGIAAVERDELVAQRVVGGVERHGQRDGQAFLGQAAHSGHDPDRRHRDVAGRDPEVVVETLHGRPGGVVVGQRLPHPHEDDVADPGRAGVLGAGHLLDDLPGGQVPFEAGLPGGAERTGHCASRLGGDAHGRPGGVAHEHGLDRCAVASGRPEPFRRLAVIGGAAVKLLESQRERNVEPAAQRKGKVRELLERRPPRVQTLPDLPRPVGRLSPPGQEPCDLVERRGVARRHVSAVRPRRPGRRGGSRSRGDGRGRPPLRWRRRRRACRW